MRRRKARSPSKQVDVGDLANIDGVVLDDAADSHDDHLNNLDGDPLNLLDDTHADDLDDFDTFKN